MDSQKRKEMALRMAVLLIAVIALVLVVFSVMLLRNNAQGDISGARYVFVQSHGER